MTRKVGPQSEQQTTGRRYSAYDKSEILRTFRLSGLSAYAFCSEVGLCYTTLRRWFEEVPSQSTGEQVDHRFVEIKVDRDEGTFDSPMEVALPDGIKIRVYEHGQVAWVAELLRLSKESAC